jgi:hypothetical protein
MTKGAWEKTPTVPKPSTVTPVVESKKKKRYKLDKKTGVFVLR